MEGLFLLLVLAACPVLMWVMMRGMGGQQSDHAQPPDEGDSESALRTEVDELRAEIDRRKQAGDDSRPRAT